MDKIWQIGKESLNLPSIQAVNLLAKANIDTDCRIFFRKRLLDALSWLSETWKISRKVKNEIRVDAHSEICYGGCRMCVSICGVSI